MLLNIIFSIVFILSSFQAKPQAIEEAYHVVQIQGIIFNATQNQTLQRGMKLNANDKIVFRSVGAKAVVLSSAKGRLILMPAKKSNTGNFKELYAFVKDVVLPVKQNVILGTRGTPSEVMDFKNYFGDDNFYIVGNTLSFKINHNRYPISEEKFFVLRYKYNAKVLNKKISYFSNGLNLSKEELFKTAEAKPIPTDSVDKVELYWFITKPKSSEKLTSYKLHFLEEEKLKSEFDELIAFEKDKIPQGNEKFEYLKDYFVQVYGKTDENVLKEWLEKNQLLD